MMRRILLNNHTVSDVINICEVDNAAHFAGELFHRSFRATIPDFPLHYIAQYRGTNADANGATAPTVGYVHFTKTDDMYLCGGMCIDAPYYRHMQSTARSRIGHAGGIAEIMLRACFQDLTDRDAIFGYCGDTKAMRVDLRAGFVPTQYQYLIVHWKRQLSLERQQELIEIANAVGAF
jgi:hypothetical protein